MTRGLHSDTITELATKNINAVHLVTVDLGGATLNVTENSFDLTSNISGSNVTYVSSGVLLDTNSIAESQNVNVSRLTLTLSAVNQTNVALVLSNNIMHNEVKIFRALLNTSNAIINNPFLLYNGFINSFEINDGGATATLKLEVESYFANSGQLNGRVCNSNSQQRFFSTDKGFDYTDKVIKDIQWGNTV